MNPCIVCGNKAPYRCQPCKAFFCEKHKAKHERNRNIVHIFEKEFDSSGRDRNVEGLILNINKLIEFKERIMLETKKLIQKIEELCTKCLENTENMIQDYKSLLELITNPISEKIYRVVKKN